MAAIVLDLAQSRTKATLEPCVEVLKLGGLVVVPTDTVYGVAFALLNDEARHRAMRLLNLPKQVYWTPHLAQTQQSTVWWSDSSPILKRLMKKAWPGPVAIQARAHEALKRVSSSLGAVTVDQGFVTLRFPDYAPLCELISETGIPIAIGSAPLLHDHGSISELAEALDRKVDAVIWDGQTKYRKPSSLVRVADGIMTVIREGAIPTRTLERMAGLTVLFVCTGNTCRSPMAGSLARRIIAEKLGTNVNSLSAQHIQVISAGVSAATGQPATLDAIAAVNELGADLGPHRAQRITQELLQQADVVFTMTHAHRDAVVGTWPWAAEKTERLNPRGDIEDPIGQGLSAYRAVARKMQEVITSRLAELLS
ncbi:MAG: Sua5/YciO/YrdC/YwlC family protein [Phycisphaerae bacterium]